MKIQPIIWKYHKTKDKTFPIKIRITSTSNGKTKVEYILIGASVKLDQWDQKSGRVKNHPNAQTINFKIIDLCNSIEKNYLNGGGIESGDKTDFYWWFQKKLKYALEKGFYNWRKLNTVYNKMIGFCPVLPIKKIDNSFLLEFESHLRSKGLHKNTISDTMMRVKVITNSIKRNGLIEFHKDPFAGYTFEYDRTEAKRITLEQVERLKDADFSKIPSADLARDMYVFSFYCFGIRFGDLCRIRKDMIIGGELVYTMHKTKVDRIINLPDQLLPIIEKYKKNKGYLFDTRVNWEIEDKSINSRNAFYNKKLKWACKEIEIPEITFHTSRNSVADLATEMGVEIGTLSNLLGHQKVSTTKIYQKKFYKEVNKQVSDKLFKNTSPPSE